MQVVYSKTFMYSSVITPLFLGIIAGSAVSGRIDLNAADFWMPIFLAGSLRFPLPLEFLL